MLINLSNHPFENWDEAQRLASAEYGNVIDLPFPAVDPDGDEQYIERLCTRYIDAIEKIIREQDENHVVVHLMGEMTFVYAVATALLKKEVPCVASTTDRIAVEENGCKTTLFRFKRFRKYILK